ncbi:methyltransferase [Kibdelosporangium lantanae]|uniref:Methyltransferase n=1 Tax=Kibdelosporangium lantanae TaxID=1497396 RepID=A0ABW3M8E8_9PSEU
MAPHTTTDGDRRLAAYVVTDPRMLPEVEEAVAADQIDEWELVFDGMYGSQRGDLADDFVITGWNSSYTNEPLSAAQMREWVDTTVAAINELTPRRVLEVGCGTGLLLQRLAPGADDYYGTDLSGGALASLRKRHDGDNVTLLHQAADIVEGLPRDHFDTMVLNSVAQYFPDVAYLTEVLTRTAGLMARPSTMFVGDIRDLRLLEAFQMSIELFRADDSMPLTRLREQISRRILEEDELLCDPRYFSALRQVIPDISEVEIRIKRGRFHNEMTCFRYDALVHLGTRPVRPAEEWVEWTPETTVDSLLTGDAVRITGIPNPRVVRELRAVELLRAAAPGATVQDLRRELDRTPLVGLEIEDVQAIADEHGYQVRFVANMEMPGGYDAVFTCGGGVGESASGWPELAAPATYANDPIAARRRRQLVPAVREFLKTKVPQYMVPSSFIILDGLPLTPNGKVDRQALPLPDAESAVQRSAYIPPSTPTEQVVTRICAAVLGIETVGAGDNFFELGGHSLLATQFV